MPTRKLRAVETPHRNGNGQYHGLPPPAQAGAMRRVEEWLKPLFPEEIAGEYPDDWYFLYWKNHPMHLRRRYVQGSADDATVESWYEALHELVPEHNGWTWVNSAGETVAFAPASDRAFWDGIPNAVLWAIHRAVVEEFSRPLPNYQTRMLETSASTSSSESTEEVPQETESPGAMSEAK